jgi:molybdopterin synthase sulfur carrier subunit
MPASVTVRLPGSLRPLCENKETVSVEGATVGEVLANLTARYSGVGGKLFPQPGKLGKWVNVFVNGEDIRFLSDQATALKGGEEVSIVPAVAGGM